MTVLAVLLDIPPFIGVIVSIALVVFFVATFLGSVVIEALVMWRLKWASLKRSVLDALAMNGVSFSVGLFSAMVGWPLDSVWVLLLAAAPLVGVEWLVVRTLRPERRARALPVVVLANASSVPFVIAAVSWFS